MSQFGRKNLIIPSMRRMITNHLIEVGVIPQNQKSEGRLRQMGEKITMDMLID